MRKAGIKPVNLRILVILAVGCLGVWMLFRLGGSTEKKMIPQMAKEMSKGLNTGDESFWINGRKTKLFSGAIHYFRIPRVHWRDRLMKLRASGCNVVETYVAWNAHEPVEGEFNFEENLDIRSFVKLAADCGLYVIVRPGPYICSEWDLGGLPAWLLRDPDMKLRSTYPRFMSATEKYFQKLLPQITDLQYEHGTGPIIAWQIENEYGSYGSDTEYLKQIKMMMEKNGVKELLFTSDNEQGLERGSVPDVLMTANFQEVYLGQSLLDLLKKYQPDKPRMVMEFWTGWFDHWKQPHQTWSLDKFEKSLQYILNRYGNVNFYMFHGGTNFGFMNGANEQTINDQLKNGPQYAPDTTSYDYDAPLNERGEITPKYETLKRLIKPYLSELSYYGEIPANIDLPPAKSYGEVAVTSQLSFHDLVKLTHSESIKGKVATMEMLPSYTQTYGWILYEKRIDDGDLEVRNGELLIEGSVRDYTRVFFDDVQILVFDCNLQEAPRRSLNSVGKKGKLGILIENQGRSNYQPPDKQNILDSQRKGLGVENKVILDGQEMVNWKTYSLDFSTEMMTKIESAEFSSYAVERVKTPVLLKAVLNIADIRRYDTFLDMSGWGKGIVIINGKNIGRYWHVGPTSTLYVPGPWLNHGNNTIYVFEEEKTNPHLEFIDHSKLG